MFLRICLLTIVGLVISFAQESALQPEKQPEDIPALIAAGNGHVLKGEYMDAQGLFEKAWDVAKTLRNEDPLRYEAVKRLAAVHAAVGEFTEANDFLALAISWREQTNGNLDPKIADDLLLSAGYLK